MELHINNWWDLTMFIIGVIPCMLFSVLVFIIMLYDSIEKLFKKGESKGIIVILFFIAVLVYKYNTKN